MKPETVADGLFRSAATRPDALAWATRGARLSFAEAASNVDRLAGCLARRGIGRGDVVALLLPNGIDYAAALFATLHAGAIAEPLDPQISTTNLSYLLALAGVKAIFVDPRLASPLLESLPGLATLGLVVASRADAKLADAARLAGCELVEGFDPNETLAATASSASLEDAALVIPTTGTTGRPKAVVLTHANLLAIRHQIHVRVGLGASDLEVTALPLSRMFGLAHLFCYAAAGGAMVMEENFFFPAKTLALVSKFGATSFPAVPTSYEILLDRFEPLVREHAATLRYVMFCSAPVRPETVARLRELLPEAQIFQTYGLTEAVRSTFVDFGELPRERWTTVGRALPGVEVTIRDDSGEALPIGGEGEVTIAGPHVFAGYLVAPGRVDRSPVTARGFATGDLGRLDPDGYLHLTGRKKDLVNVGGFKFHPLEVEEILVALPGVTDAAVVGVRDPEGIVNEIPVACIVAPRDARPDEAALLAVLRARLEPYKVPRRFFFVSDIPRTISGKIQRFRLIEQATALFAAASRGDRRA